MPSRSEARRGKSRRGRPSPGAMRKEDGTGPSVVRGEAGAGPDVLLDRLAELRRSVIVLGTATLARDGIGCNRPLSAPGVDWIVAGQRNLPEVLDPWWIGARSVTTLQNWRGTVESVSEDHVRVRLTDLTVPSLDDEFTRIPISDLDPKDGDRLEVGSVFSFTIGYTRGDDGAMRRESLISLREEVGSNDRTGSELAWLLDQVADER